MSGGYYFIFHNHNDNFFLINLDFLLVYSEHKALLEAMGIPQSQIVARLKKFPSRFKTKVTSNISPIMCGLMLKIIYLLINTNFCHYIDVSVANSKITYCTDNLYSLSQGSLQRYTSYHCCIINGIRFRCILHDDAFRTQCSGVYTKGEHDNEGIYIMGSSLKSCN